MNYFSAYKTNKLKQCRCLQDNETIKLNHQPYLLDNNANKFGHALCFFCSATNKFNDSHCSDGNKTNQSANAPYLLDAAISKFAKVTCSGEDETIKSGRGLNSFGKQNYLYSNALLIVPASLKQSGCAYQCNTFIIASAEFQLRNTHLKKFRLYNYTLLLMLN